MKLDIRANDKHYKSDNIANGRIIKKFFLNLSDNIFKQSLKYWEHHKNLMGEDEAGGGEIPLLWGERNLYSTISVALNQITPLHLSEWQFNESEHQNEKAGTRRPDFWCAYKDGDTGQPLNYFIEIKKGAYCLNRVSEPEVTQKVLDDFEDIIEQSRKLKKISPNWAGFEDVFLGLFIIQGYFRDGEEHYDETHVLNSFRDNMDSRTHAQLIMNTWYVSEKMNIQWTRDKCRFISIVGVAISKKRT